LKKFHNSDYEPVNHMSSLYLVKCRTQASDQSYTAACFHQKVDGSANVQDDKVLW